MLLSRVFNYRIHTLSFVVQTFVTCLNIFGLYKQFVTRETIFFRAILMFRHVDRQISSQGGCMCSTGAVGGCRCFSNCYGGFVHCQHCWQGYKATCERQISSHTAMGSQA